MSIVLIPRVVGLRLDTLPVANADPRPKAHA